MLLTNLFLFFALFLIAPVVNGINFPPFPQFPKMDDLGSKIQEQISGSFNKMGNLGDKIRNDIENKMLPLKRMQTMTSISNGIGGTTIAFYNTGQPSLIRNGKVFKCFGRLTFGYPRPDCAGSLQEFQIRTFQDVCHAKNYAQVNDHLCLVVKRNSQMKFSYANGRYQCYEADGSPAILMSFAQFRQTCGALPSDTIYRYYPDRQDPSMVPLDSRYLDCMQKDANSCTFKLHNGANNQVSQTSSTVQYSA